MYQQSIMQGNQDTARAGCTVPPTASWYDVWKLKNSCLFGLSVRTHQSLQRGYFSNFSIASHSRAVREFDKELLTESSQSTGTGTEISRPLHHV
ncbi:hypothetical protein RRG08_014464 [Elysia crispata]|uniref:Uncharacterized protein n=1 Tax=Elysia crispata TaxID=231223 RepID=A0AAE0Y617_9GAST|nr:hypothetical protein RRG08_014464 [Elysia crispata]